MVTDHVEHNYFQYKDSSSIPLFEVIRKSLDNRKASVKGFIASPNTHEIII